MTRTYNVVIDSDDSDPLGEAQDIASMLDEQYNVISVVPAPSGPTLNQPPTQQTFPKQ